MHAAVKVHIFNLEDPMIHEDEGREPSKSFAAGNGADAKSGKHFLSKRELALVIGVSPRTVDNWMAQKRIPFLRLSTRLIKFNLERVKAALARYEVKEVGARR
jgi:excisionase family DNA binding protein